MEKEKEREAVKMLEKTIIQALDKKSQGNPKEYSKVVCFLNSTKMNAYKLWFLALRQSVVRIKQDCDDLVAAILNFPWGVPVRGPNLGATEEQKNQLYEEVKEASLAFESLLLCLLSANGSLTSKILPKIAEACVIRTSAPGCLYVIPFDQFLREHFHPFLQKTFVTVPTSSTLLFPLLQSNFPYKTRDLTVMVSYVTQLLHISSYCPVLREQIIALVVDRLIQIDVEIKVEENVQNDSIFDFDSEERDFSGNYQVEKDNTGSQMAEKLDACMNIFFSYFEDLCSDRQRRGVTFDFMLKLFANAILHTYQCKYVQFLIFYLCKFDIEYPQKFLALLLDMIFRTNCHVMTRQLCIYYAASFLARYKQLPTAVVRSCLSLMTQFLHNFVNSSDNGDLDEKRIKLHSAHGVQITLFQAVCYVVIFRQAELIDKEGGDYFRGLHLELIIESKLNPILYCQRRVVKEFSRVVQSRHLLNMQKVLDRNKRLFGAADFEQVEFYYPFDPYLLEGSQKFISDLYIEWNGANDDDQSDDENSEEESYELVSSDDDDENVQYKRRERNPETPVEVDIMSFTPDVGWEINFQFMSSNKQKMFST